MSEEKEQNSGFTVGGVSGNKKMRLGRVHKKKFDEDAVNGEAETRSETAADSSVETASFTAAMSDEPERNTESKTDTRSESTGESKSDSKVSAAKASQAKSGEARPAVADDKNKAAEDGVLTAEEKKTQKKPRTKQKEDEPKDGAKSSQTHAAAETSKKADTREKQNQANKSEHEAAAAVKVADNNEQTAKTEQPGKTEQMKKPDQTKKAEQPARAEQSGKTEQKPVRAQSAHSDRTTESTEAAASVAAEGKGNAGKTDNDSVKNGAEPVEPRKTKLSSAVISLGDALARGETISSSTVITHPGGDRKTPARSGGYNGSRPQGGSGYGSRPQGGGGYGGSRPQGNGGSRSGYSGGARAGGVVDKDKDEEGSSKNQQRRAPKPKVNAGNLEEVKKSRTSYAEKSAFEKKHSDSDHREGGKNVAAGKRKSVRGSQFDGGEYDEYSHKRKKRNQAERYEEQEQQQITEIKIPPFITVKEFAEGIGKKSSEIIMELMKLGVMATINQELDFDTACLVADALGISAELLEEKTEEDILFAEEEDNDANMEPRPPVVVVMGHVDHGKTSLLDRIRSTNVIEGEAGGITQKIGAYTVRLKGRQITFLDTPGHEAFTTMRARGAQFTDIAILVVAADDGVMPQTIEAINHAKAANTEIIVAINKIDKPGANPDKVKQELTNYGLVPEEWGGSNIMIPISAKKGIGIDELLENVLLTADVMELKADPKGQARGAVIEAQLDKSRGPVASVLVQKGTLKQGDTVVCGPIMGNVRAMYDDKANPIKKAGPSVPVEIIGLPEVPVAGELLYAVTDDKMARQLVEKRKIKQREDQLHRSSKMSLETLAAQMAAGDVKDLNLIIKADVQGSVEAVQQSMEKLTNGEVKVNIIHSAVGAINESDIVLADVSNAIIIGFNVRPNQMIVDKAKEANVDIRLYSVIYNAIEDVENAMKGMLAPKIEEVVWGHAEIRALFKVSGIGTIGGSYVTDGKILRGCSIRVIRDDIIVYTGVLGSLQHEKDSVKEVVSGHECGLTVEKYNDIKVGDVIEAFGNVEVARD